MKLKRNEKCLRFQVIVFGSTTNQENNQERNETCFNAKSLACNVRENVN